MDESQVEKLRNALLAADRRADTAEERVGTVEQRAGTAEQRADKVERRANMAEQLTARTSFLNFSSCVTITLLFFFASRPIDP